MIKLNYIVEDFKVLIELSNLDFEIDGETNDSTLIDINENSITELEQRIEEDVFGDLLMSVVIERDDNGYSIPPEQIEITDEDGTIEGILTVSEKIEIANEVYNLLITECPFIARFSIDTTKL